MKQILILLAIIAVMIEATPWKASPRTDKHFVSRHESLLNTTHHHAAHEAVIFIGASTVENWLHAGAELWRAHYARRHAYNYGIGGDRTEHVLWRIEHGELDHVKAKIVVICVGFNNLNGNDNGEDTARGISAVIQAIQHKIANVQVLLLGILPSGLHNTAIYETNQRLPGEIAKLPPAERAAVHFLDMTKHFEQSRRQYNASLYVHDKIHLNAHGYQVWYEVMEPLFAKLLAKK